MCLACVLSERARVRLAMVLMFFSITGTTFSKMVILAGYHLLTRLQKYLSTVETYDATHLPILLMCAGVFGLIVNAFGIYLYFRCLYPLQRSQLSIQIFWHLAGCGLLCILNVCIIVLIMLYYLRIDTTFGGGILSVMKEYRRNTTSKSRIDDLQVYFKCCGSEDYTDWFRVAWIPDAFINANEPEVRLRLKNGIYESDDVPYSCCNPKATRPCVNFHVHDDTKHFNYFHSKDLTIFQGGCREMLKNHFVENVISPALGMSTALFILNLLVLLMARYLHTSMIAALETGYPTAEARGYASQCCIFVTEEMLNIVMKQDPHSSNDENIRPSVPAMCGQPPRPYLSTSTTKS